MTIHINADRGQIAESLLLPGDPQRARFFAETYLTDAKQVSDLRGMFCYTGTYEGRPVSVMGSGMGLPSLSIYVNELYREYGVKQIIRVGSCGSLQTSVKINDIVLAQAACTNSAINRRRFINIDYAPLADFSLLMAAYRRAEDRSLSFHVGNILSNDTFYDPEPDAWKRLAAYGVLAVEMETAELYTLAAQYGRKALSILTVSDSLADDSANILQDRERGMGAMAELALAIAN